MSATPTEAGRLPSWFRRSGAALLAPLLTAALLASCAEEPLPQRKITADDCLAEVQLDRLQESLERCGRVVAAFPADPTPLNERYLLHSLAGDRAAACRDIERAAALARRIPAAKLDRLLRNDLELRVAGCRR